MATKRARELFTGEISLVYPSPARELADRRFETHWYRFERRRDIVEVWSEKERAPGGRREDQVLEFSLQYNEVPGLGGKDVQLDVTTTRRESDNVIVDVEINALWIEDRSAPSARLFDTKYPLQAVKLYARRTNEIPCNLDLASQKGWIDSNVYNIRHRPIDFYVAPPTPPHCIWCGALETLCRCEHHTKEKKVVEEPKKIFVPYRRPLMRM